MIALNTAPTVTDLTSGVHGTPMFVMAGACPSVFAGMQAVVFTAMGPSSTVQPTVDFWCVRAGWHARLAAMAPTRRVLRPCVLLVSC